MIEQIDGAMLLRMINQGLDLEIRDAVGEVDRMLGQIVRGLKLGFEIAFINTGDIRDEKPKIYEYNGDVPTSDEDLYRRAEEILKKEIERLKNPEYALALVTVDGFGNLEHIYFIDDIDDIPAGESVK